MRIIIIPMWLILVFVFRLSCLAGIEVIPLKLENLEVRGDEPLVTREYKVPSNYLKLIAKQREAAPKKRPADNRTEPFTPKPSVIFIQERNVLIVRAGKNEHSLVKAHVSQVWKIFRE